MLKKRVGIFVISLMCISSSLSGCGSKATPEAVTENVSEVTDEVTPEVTPEVISEVIPEASSEVITEETSKEAPDTISKSETDDVTQETHETATQVPFEEELLYMGEGPYKPNILKTPENAVFYRISQVSKEPNEIIDENEWFADNGFLDPRVQSQEGYFLESGQMYIYRCGDNLYYPTKLEFYDIESNFVGTIDFQQYIDPTYIEFEDWPTIPASVSYAQVVVEPDGRRLLYASVSHNTYADYFPDNAYILCIDLDTQVLLWKSEALVSNAYNFAIKDGTIFSGYGFTDEADFVYTLDRYTGKILEQVKVKTGPDFLFERDNKLYVRCYDTDYIFDILE